MYRILSLKRKPSPTSSTSSSRLFPALRPRGTIFDLFPHTHHKIRSKISPHCLCGTPVFGLVMLVTIMWGAAQAEEPNAGEWKVVHRLSPPARIDAVTDLGGGRVVVGTRHHSTQPFGGWIAASDDFGQTWEEYGCVIDGQILNLLSLDSQTVLASTLEGEIWKSADRAKTWRKTRHVSPIRLYSMVLTENGTVLTASADQTDGGRVFRSTDQGETWSDIGVISPKGLYRFQKVRDGVLLNGWAGHIYKSIDDGRSWHSVGQISNHPLYPIEALPNGVVLTGDEAGQIFRSSDDGKSWTTVTDVQQPHDDFVWVRGELVYLSSYLGTKHLFVSQDAGVTWSDIGPTPDGDILDHVVSLQDAKVPTAVGGTTEGRILRLELRRGTEQGLGNTER